MLFRSVQLGTGTAAVGAAADSRHEVDRRSSEVCSVGASECDPLCCDATKLDRESRMPAIADEPNACKQRVIQSEQRIGVADARRRKGVHKGGKVVERQCASHQFEFDGKGRLHLRTLRFERRAERSNRRLPVLRLEGATACAIVTAVAKK